MKSTFKVLACIFALGFVIMTALQLLAQHGLSRMMREGVLPRIKQETGIDVHVGRLSVSLANSQLVLKRVEVRNPAGFPPKNLALIDRAVVSVDMASLFSHKPFLVRSVELNGVLVNVVRSRDGVLNIAQLLGRKHLSVASKTGAVPQAPPVKGPVPQAGLPAAKQAPPPPLPEVLVDALNGHAKLRYLDLGASALDITLNLELTGKGLSTCSATNTPWGLLKLTGAMANESSRFDTHLKLRLSPVTDLKALSFDLTGQIKDIDPRFLEGACRSTGIRLASFDVEPILRCQNGAFENSKIALNLRDIKLEDKLAKQTGEAGTADALHLVLPVVGILQKPVIDIESSLMPAFGKNAKSLFGSFLQGGTPDDTGVNELPKPQ